MTRTLKVVLWNIQWRSRSSAFGAAIRCVIAEEQPDIVCLTEAHAGFLDDGHELVSAPDYGLGPQGSRRKVVLWSRMPWDMADAVGSASMPGGRFVSGSTRSPIGPLAVMGVCVPWSMAHVASGRRDRGPWDEHRNYLHGLAEVASRERSSPALLLGDFNQTLQRRRQPADVHAQLASIFASGWTVAGVGRNELAIDHCAICGPLSIMGWQELANTDDAGRRLSDHVGIALRLEGAIDGYDRS